MTAKENTFLDNIFKYDKFINNSELKYPKLNKNIEKEMNLSSSLKKYEGEFPMNNSGVMYYNVYNNSKEIKEKYIGDVKPINKSINVINEYKDNRDNIDNSFNNSNNLDENKNFYKTYGGFINMNNKNDDNFLLNSNNSLSNQGEFHAFTLSSFSFKK